MTPTAVSRLAPLLRGAAHRVAAPSRHGVACPPPRAWFRPPSRAASRAQTSGTRASLGGEFATSPWVVPTWDVRVLFDGECPLCVREVNFLRAKDNGRGRLDLVDIASPAYDPGVNRGIDFVTAMGTIHGIKKDGTVLTGVPVFDAAYSAVGLGWVYAFTKNETAAKVAGKIYDFWAARRLQVTGRPSLTQVLEARSRREAANGATACAAEAKTDAKKEKQETRKPGVASDDEFDAFLARNVTRQITVVDARNPDFFVEPDDERFGGQEGSAPIGDCGTEKRPNAINAPFDRATKSLPTESITKKTNGDLTSPIITHCGGGGRGLAAKIFLEGKGYTNVVNGGGPAVSALWEKFGEK